MNYEKIYTDFIIDRRRKEHSLREADVYVEQHHILPRSLGGNNLPENLIYLTAEDHFFAHELLAEIHGGRQWFAVIRMNGKNRQSRKLYAKARKKMSEATKGVNSVWYGKRHTLESRKKMSGVTRSPETRTKISIAKLGEKNPRYSKRLSLEEKIKLSIALSGRHVSSQTRKKLSIALSGEKNPNYNKHFSLETRAKMSAVHLGKHHSLESRAKISSAMTGRVFSLETRAKMSAAASKRYRTVTDLQKD